LFQISEKGILADAAPSYPVTTVHEPHYDVLAAAVTGTSATVLTLLAMLGGSGITSMLGKMLFDAQLWVIELALVVGMVGLLVRSTTNKRRLSHLAAILLVIATVLIAATAVLPL
jgi:hypothetical protein